MGGQRTAVGLPPWTSVPNIISSCEDPSYFAIVPNLEVTSISVHSVLPLILMCFYFRIIVTTTLEGKKKKQKEKSACQNSLTHDGQRILDCRGPRRGEGEDEEEKCKIEK